jgi:hypothetical protein
MVCPEPRVIVLFLGRGIDPTSLIAAKRKFFVIAGDNVLSQLGADRFEPIAKVADDREVMNDGMSALADVKQNPDPDHNDRAREPSHPPHTATSKQE